MMSKRTYLRSHSEKVTLGNANMEIKICRKTGRILSLLHKKKHFGWNTSPGRLEIYDGLADRHFSGEESAGKMTLRVEKGDEPSVTLTRRFMRAQFLVKETFKAADDSIHWEVEILLDKGKQERSIEIRQLVPWPESPWGWMAWSAQHMFPTHTHNIAGLHLEYGDICFGTVIPAVTIYNPGKDVGLAIAKPLGQLNPRTSFCFTDYHGEGIFVENDLLGLRRGKPVKAALMLRFHEGCFRPTLAWLLKKYPEYFLPGNPAVRQYEGGSMFGPPHVSKKDAARMAKAGMKWYEIHQSFPMYGQYCPEKEPWFDGSFPDVHMDYGKPITTRVINDCGRNLAERGIGSFLYFQVTGNAYMPRWPKRWKSSLARYRSGKLILLGCMSAFANSDPSLPFGKEMERQVRGVLKRYPDITGIFLDQACYNGIDCAHDDGITMYKNKPAYRLRYNYDKHVPALVEGLHRRGKIIYANGTYDIELGKGFDGNMAESTSIFAATMKYMHIAKPLLFFAYCRDEDDVENMLQNCLLAGASWALWVKTAEGWFVKKDLASRQKKIYERYLPLCRRLLGRRMLLEPNPIRLPKSSGTFGDESAGEVTLGESESAAVSSEIFVGENGDILISLVTRKKHCLDKSNLTKNVRIVVRTKRAKDIRRAYALGADYRGTRPVRMNRKGKELFLTLAVHGAASLVVLETRKKSRK